MNKIAETLHMLSTTDKNANRKTMLDFEAHMMSEEQVSIPASHVANGGMYMRHITIPKDTFITGAIYKYDHIDVMISGRMVVSTDDGTIKELSGFNMFPSQSGKKRAGYAIEETLWVTVNSVPNISPDADSEETQKMLTAADFDEYNELRAFADRMDYERFLGEISITEEQIRKESETQEDMAPHCDSDTIVVADSLIEGKGVFAVRQIEKGEVIWPARVNGFRTEMGRYVNHSIRPNSCIVAAEDGDINSVAVARINIGDEITSSYRQTIQTRFEENDLCQA